MLMQLKVECLTGQVKLATAYRVWEVLTGPTERTVDLLDLVALDDLTKSANYFKEALPGAWWSPVVRSTGAAATIRVSLLGGRDGIRRVWNQGPPYDDWDVGYIQDEMEAVTPLDLTVTAGYVGPVFRVTRFL